MPVQTDRPSGKPERFSPTRCGASTRGAWPRSWPPSPATCRAPAFRSATRGRLRAAVALLFVVAFAFSYRPAGRQRHRRVSSRTSAIDAIPPRIDAWVTPPRLHRQGAGLPDLRSQPGHAGLHRAGRQRRVAARDRRLRRGDAELHRRLRQCPRDRRQARPPARPSLPPAALVHVAAVCRQAHQRRHAVAEVRRRRRRTAGRSP